MSRLVNNIFNKDSYSYNGRINYGFMAAVLETLKMTQYKYKREDVVRLYHFIADVIEKGNFEWPGKIDLKPFEKNDKVETKEVESTVVSASEDTTSKKSQKRSAKPVEDERRLV